VRQGLIGTSGQEVELGFGVTRGFRWGTLTARASGLYEGGSDTKLAFGECAVEYLKRVSPGWRLFAAVQGAEDEVTLITEAQWHLTRQRVHPLQPGAGLDAERDALGATARDPVRDPYAPLFERRGEA